jgi:hypothetical protein
MKFTPKSEEEISAANLLAGGDYDFEIAKAEEAESKAGNEMIALTLHIEGEEGRRHTVFDYLVGADSSMFKVRGFAESVGLLQEYNKGEMPADILPGRTGRCQIGIDDKNKAYAPKNVVRAYHKPASSGNGAMPPKAAAATRPPIDDDIPF